MNTLDLLDLADEVLSIDDGTSQDDLLATYQRVLYFKEKMNEIAQSAKEAVIEWMKDNEVKKIEIDDQRYYRLKRVKKVTCRDVTETAHRLLDATGGELDKVLGLLASDAWKHGSCHQVLGDEGYEACFETTFVEDLELKKPKLQLVIHDKQFER